MGIYILKKDLAGSGKHLNQSEDEMKYVLRGIVVLAVVIVVFLGLVIWLTPIPDPVSLDPNYPPQFSAKEIAKFTELAMAGDTNASISLAMYYGMNEKYEERMRWLQVSADLGDEYMQESLDGWKRPKREGGTGPRSDFFELDGDKIIIKSTGEELKSGVVVPR